MSANEMNSKTEKRGSLNFIASNGVLAVRRKDNKVVTLLSTGCGASGQSQEV